jgi:cell division FtsZ-interacting protein ZapD
MHQRAHWHGKQETDRGTNKTSGCSTEEIPGGTASLPTGTLHAFQRLPEHDHLHRDRQALTTLLKICNALSINPALLFSSEDDARVLARKDMHRLVDEYF